MGLGKTIYSIAHNNVPTKYSNMSKDQIAEAVNKKVLEEIGVENFSGKQFSKLMRRENVRVKMYEIIEEVVDQIMANGDYKKNEFFNRFVELKNLALGDTNEFYVEGDNTLEVVEFAGDNFNLNRERYDNGASFEVKLRNFGISVFEYSKRILSGRCDFGKLVADMSEAISKAISKLAYETFQAALVTLPSEFRQSGSYAETDIIEKAQHVQASTEEKPFFLGSALALSKLQGVTDIAKYSDAMKDELNNGLFLRTWKGYECIEIPQGHKKGTFDFTIDDSVVYIMSGNEKPVKMILEGESEYMEKTAVWNGAMNADKSVENAITYRAGACVAYNKMFAVIEIA